jgi:hypothetical protein
LMVIRFRMAISWPVLIPHHEQRAIPRQNPKILAPHWLQFFFKRPSFLAVKFMGAHPGCPGAWATVADIGFMRLLLKGQPINLRDTESGLTRGETLLLICLPGRRYCGQRDGTSYEIHDYSDLLEPVPDGVRSQ